MLTLENYRNKIVNSSQPSLLLTCGAGVKNQLTVVYEGAYTMQANDTYIVYCNKTNPDVTFRAVDDSTLLCMENTNASNFFSCGGRTVVFQGGTVELSGLKEIFGSARTL